MTANMPAEFERERNMTAMSDDPNNALQRRRETRLAVVVPMYNEIVGAETCIRRILSVIPKLALPTELIVVDDGSSDGTGDLLDDLRRRLGAFTVVHKPNGGYGSALSAGARAALERTDDYILFMDSDLTNPPEHIARFVPSILRGVDLVKGSRFSKGGDMDAVPWRRRIMSVGGNLVARALFRMGVADCTNGFRAIKTRLYLDMPLKERGFAIILEELYWAKRAGISVESVPTSLSTRSDDLRSSLFLYRPVVIWAYLKYALKAGVVRYSPPRLLHPS
jgi:dolichol-phosphate mannosyltransferase